MIIRLVDSFLLSHKYYKKNLQLIINISDEWLLFKNSTQYNIKMLYFHLSQQLVR